MGFAVTFMALSRKRKDANVTTAAIAAINNGFLNAVETAFSINFERPVCMDAVFLGQKILSPRT